MMDLQVPLNTAILGGTVRIPTIDGDVDMIIPSGTQSESKKILRGRGVKRLRGSRGDQIVTVKVSIPTGLTEKQKDLLREAFQDTVSRPTTKKTSDPKQDTKRDEETKKEESEGGFVKFFKDLADKRKNTK
jgi:molecular chaperone DnaJ